MITIGSQTYELHKHYHHSVELNVVNRNVFYNIRDTLMYDFNVPHFYSHGFENDIGAELKDASGKKITTRIYQWLWKNHQFKPSQELKTRIGNMITDATIKARDYEFDITDRFDWEDGDYGDEGSCYWSDRSGARQSLENAGCLAIRFYREEIVGRNYDLTPSEPIYGIRGFARAWLFPYTEGRYVLFNGYGLETKEIAQFLGSLTGLYVYRLDSLTNNNDTTGLIYIGGADRGMINGKTGYLLTGIQNDPERDIDLGVEEIEDEPEIFTECYDCNDPIEYEDDAYCVNGEYYCEHCFNHFTSCEHCDDYVHEDDILLTADYYYLCGYCYDNRTHTCDHCNDVYYSERAIVGTTYNGESVCRDCLDEYTSCENCGDLVNANDQVVADNLHCYCPNCASDILQECNDCGHLHETNLLTEGLCNACQRQHSHA